MAKVKATVLKPLSYGGKQYNPDDEVTMDASHVSKYERLDIISVPKADAPKVKAAEGKKENN